MQVGQKIRKFRDERNYSQSEMAERMGISQSAYSRIERNETPITVDELIRVSKTLNVPLQEFLPDSISIQNVNERGHGGPNLIMGDFHYHHTEESKHQEVIIELLRKMLDRLEESGK